LFIEKKKMSYQLDTQKTKRKKEKGEGGGGEGQGEKTRGGWREEGERRKEIVVGQTAPVRYDASVSVRARLRCLGPGEILKGRSRFS
jgi:hypothetical protein